MKCRLILLSWYSYTIISKPNVNADTSEMNEVDSFWRSKTWREENNPTQIQIHQAGNTSTTNTNNAPFRCYHGGIMYRDHEHTYDESIMLNVLPECNGEVTSLTKHNIELAKNNDILFYHDNAPKRWSFNDIDPHAFPGKVLFIVEEWRRWYMFTESRGDGVDVMEARNDCAKNRYYIGSMADSACSVWIPLLSMYMQDLPVLERSTLFDPTLTLKRVNTKEHFLIYIASHRVTFREEAFLQLSFLVEEEVHYGGSCHGNPLLSNLVNAPVFCPDNELSTYPHIQKSPYITRRRFLDKNEEIYNHYRFALLLENANEKGYITEKIMNAFLGGSIPIWYGTTDVFDIFNPRSFIYYNVRNPTPALEKIKYLEGNRTAYDAMLREPILAHGVETIKKYFSFRGDVGGGFIQRKLRRLLGVEDAVTHTTSFLRVG